MGKLGVLVGFGAGYVLGARAGRERYEQIMDQLRRARNDPRVQMAAEQAVGVAAEQAQHAREAVGEMAGQAGAAVKEKVGEAAEAAKERMPGSSGGTSEEWPTSGPTPGTPGTPH